MKLTNMKVIFIISVFALCLTSLYAGKNSLLRKRENADGKADEKKVDGKFEIRRKDKSCTEIILAKKPIKVGPRNVDLDQLPSEVQTDKAVKDLAMRQTSASKKVFYTLPKPVKDLFTKAAVSYKKFYAFMTTKKLDIFELLGGEQRQTSSNGTWREFNHIKRDIFPDITPAKFHEEVIDRIVKGTALPRDYFGFVGYLGDIIATLQDVKNKGKKEEGLVKLANAMTEYFGDKLTKLSNDYFNAFSPDGFYENKGKKKSVERQTCAGPDPKDPTKLDLKTLPRNGVLNVGKTVDLVIAKGKKPEQLLPSIGWQWQTLPKEVIDSCPTEPWAGHVSGSFYELAFMFELLERENPTDTALPTTEKKKLYCRVAASFLIATGMHTALEVRHPMEKYIKGDIEIKKIGLDEIKADPICKGATDYVVGEINELIK